MGDCTNESGKHCWERGCFIMVRSTATGRNVETPCPTCADCGAERLRYDGPPLTLDMRVGKMVPLAETFTDAQLRAECVRRGIVHGCTHGPDQSTTHWTCHCGKGGKADGLRESQEAMAAHMLESGCTVQEPGPNGAKLIARSLKDSDLGAECERRGHTPRTPTVDRLLMERDSLLTERDEWRRRAEAAEAKLGDVGHEVTCAIQRHDGLPALLRILTNERGPGIAAMREDTSLDVDPLDLLSDDA